ncbi:uncharacterized protein C2orf81 homolog [Syngnathus typhle]|uniref:uncharacterized protein C2orf81 homolog n=1 Tax=Syngnathus typhle TaxID=161592 RepID=UPI002A6B7CD7|nr:uncharacterized protein C2orf81 homolog [Syngnathus typhle]
MSRSTSKAQADKGKTPARISPPPSQEPEEEDIIPGCLTQSQWMEMLAQEEADDVIGEIMTDLMTNVMEGCYNVHIKRQLSSFTAYWAMDYFIQTVEQKFMCRDKWEDAMELSGTEDSEPIPITPDVWAEGCFPVIHGTPPPEPVSPPQEASICEDLELAYSEENQQDVPMPQTSITPEPPQGKIGPSGHVGDENCQEPSPEQPEGEISPSRHVNDEMCQEPSPCPKPKTSTKKKQKARSTVSCAAEKTETNGDNKVPSGSKHTASQPLKAKQTISKLNHSSLPRHWITPHYEIDKCTKSSTKKSGEHSKPVPSSQQTGLVGTSRNPVSRDQSERLSSVKDEKMMARALRMDTINLAKGVSLVEPHKTKIKQLPLKSQAHTARLRPINSESVETNFPVDELTTKRPPQVTQLLPSDKFKF